MPEVCRRVVFMTGDELGPDTREFLEATGARSVNKPFDLDQIRRAVQGRPGAIDTGGVRRSE